MEDRELLELAAKAAGMEIGRYADHLDDFGSGFNLVNTNLWWNPLDDDGDALRLAVKLGLEIDVGVSCALVWRRKSEGEIEEHIKKRFDIYAATRRAIVRCAAQIGRSM